MDKAFWMKPLAALAQLSIGLLLMVGMAYVIGLALRVGCRAFLLGWRGSW